MTNIKDIAREAQVSIATVSRVFNNSRDVSAATSDKVLSIAKRLNYQPSRAARNLRRSGRGERELNYTIALALSSAQSLAAHPFIAELMAGVERELHRHGFHLHILHIEDGASLLPAIEAGHIDAIIGHCAIPNAKEFPEDFPIILLDAYYDGQRAYSVVPDYRSGIKEAVKGMLRAQRKKIAVFIDGQKEANDFAFTGQIYRGCQDAFDEVGLPFSDDIFVGAAFTSEEGYALTKAIIKRKPDVVLSNDTAAVGVLRALSELNVAVPDDVAVHGIDGLQVGAFLKPSLSTIDVQPEAIGRRAAELIVQMLKDDKIRIGMELFDVNHIKRESCLF